ncbi:cytochrome C assembly family protein [Stenoxybacter acetivorans]|uniref:cytochrome C assembly family protein n=1 Tax=Stenoxybacter acetivorans TaxID=422441 RepID=UPI000565AAF0|nr:cytochrome c biogenesis protein CcsA [Stenoxybacter acetivorans]
MNLLLLALALLYIGLSVFVWRFWLRQSGASYPIHTELAVLALVLLLHTSVIWLPLLHDRQLIIGFGHALSLVAWLMVLLYWCGNFFYPLKGLQLLLYPCAAVSMLLAAFLPGGQAAYHLQNLPFMLHISSALLAYGLFGITALLAILLLVLNRQLHRRAMSPMLQALPPLLSIEKLMFQGIWAGFILLTIAVISGTVFAEAVFGAPAAFTHKTVFGVLSWLIYAGILLKHYFQAWRGKKAAWWVIVAFICLMLAYIGSKFVLEIILHRM